MFDLGQRRVTCVRGCGRCRNFTLLKMDRERRCTRLDRYLLGKLIITLQAAYRVPQRTASVGFGYHCRIEEQTERRSCGLKRNQCNGCGIELGSGIRRLGLKDWVVQRKNRLSD